MTQGNRSTVDAMQAILQTIYEQEELPSLSAVVVRNGAPIWFGNCGVANLETAQPVTSDTIYHIGSVTKVFTAFALMQLRDAGRLQLDDVLGRYVPEVVRAEHAAITLRQLASHTSGLPRMLPLPELAEVMQTFPPTIESLRRMVFPTIAQMLDMLPQVELMLTPGTQASYSNLGVALLGHVVAVAANTPYTTYVEQQTLRPLGMSHSGFDRADDPAAATCYLQFFNPPHPAPPEMKAIKGSVPAGGLWSSARDIGKLLSCLTATADTSDTFLSRASLNEMCQMVASWEDARDSEADNGMGIGWSLSELNGTRLVQHSGGDPSTAAHVAWLPEHHLAAFVATNSGQNPAIVPETVTALLESAL